MGYKSTSEPIDYRYVVTVQPVSLPITLDNFKMYARIDRDDAEHNNFIIDIILKTAVVRAERITKKSFINRTFTTYRDCLNSNIQLRKAPFNSLVSFKYYDEDNILTDVPSDSYYTDIRHDFGYIFELENKYPNNIRQRTSNIVIEFISGYGDDSSNIPPDLINAMYQDAVFIYANRGDCDDMLNPNKLGMPVIIRNVYLEYRPFELSEKPFF